MKKRKWNQKKNKKRIAIFVAIVLLMVTVVSQLGDFRKGIQASGTYDSWTELSTVAGLGNADNTITETVTLQGDYKVTQNTTITVSTVGVSGLTIGGDTQIYIKEGVTLTVKGGDGNGTTGGGAGIKLPDEKVLKIYGQGTLNVTGGNGGSATAGGAAGEASVSGTVTTGAGGNGGNGAGAPGSGIGGAGGAGGNGGAGGGGKTLSSGTASVSGNKGIKGDGGGIGAAMGTLYVYDTVTVTATAGTYTVQEIAAGTSSSTTKTGQIDYMYYIIASAAGGGAGGNAGKSANIGGSGAGGSGGGGGGGAGAALYNNSGHWKTNSTPTAAQSSSFELDKTAGGAGGTSGSVSNGWNSGSAGAGGSGGGVSSGGTGGTVYLSSTAAITDGISGGDTANGEGQAAAVHTLDTLTAEAYFYNDETKTYEKGTDGGTVTAGVHLPGESCTANADADTEQASVTAETVNGYSFAGWYTTSDETGNPLSKDLTYTADFKNIEKNTQTVYALFKKASKAAASANGSLNIYKGISETKADGLSAVTIPKNTVITIDGKSKTITQAATYYYTEKITVESGQESSLSSEAGEKLLFVSEPAQNYFYSGVMKDNVYVSHNEFCQYSVMTVGESMPETITALFSAAQTIVLNAEGGTLASYTEPVKMDSANAEFELPQCVRIGYDFKGWVINSSTAQTGEYIPFGSVVRYETDETHQMHLVVYTYDEEGNETVAYTAPAEEGITFSAAWDYSTFAINLVNNGATVNQFTGADYNEETKCYTYTWQEGEDAVLALPTEQDMTYEGYDFLGWYLYEDFSGPSVTEFSTHTTGAKTFYAKWGKEFRASMTISGTAIVGQTLTANAVTSEEGLTLTYQWYRDGKEIPGQTDPTYTLTSEDLGAVISCTATGTGEYTPNYSISCSTEQISNRTGDVLTGLSVTGIAQTGKTLNARVSPANVENVTWQWYRLVPNGEIVEEVLIEGAATSSYLLANVDTGYAIKCVARDAFGSVYSFTTSKVAAVSDVKLTVTEKTEAACGSGAPIKIDTQNMSAASSITITIPKGLTLTKYPDTEDSTIGNFITSVEKTENEDGTVTLVYHFEKKTNVLGFTITVEPDYTNEHGSVKLVETWYSSGEVSLSGNTAVLISNVTAQPGSGYICPVTDSPADYKIESTVYHLYQPAIYLNTQKTLTHPNYKEVSMVVPISLENYDNGIQTPVPVLYNSESGEYTELQDGKTYQMTDGEETYTVVYYDNYSVKNDAGTEAVYTGPVLVYALPQESALSTGKVSDYRFRGASADGEVLYLRFDEPVAGEYFPKYREQINIKDGNDAKTTVYYAKDRSNYTTLDVIFYEGGTDSLKLTSWIGSLDYSDRNRGNILIPYQYSNRYYAYLSYYSRENLITDMTIDYNLETIGNGMDNSKLGCRRVYICYPDTLKEGTTYQVTLTYADGTTQKYDGPYNKAKWFEAEQDIVNVEVTYHNTAENGGIMRGARAAMIYCDIYNETNQEPDGNAEADGYINATIKSMTYVKQNEETGKISEETYTKENAASAKSAYHFQTTEEFVPAVPTLDPTSIEVGDTVTVNYTFGNYINPGATYNPDAYMLMPTGYLYKAGSYQKNAHKDYMASALEKTDLSTIYSTDGILPEAETLLETGKDAGGNVVYQIFGRSVMVNETRYNAYRISYSDNTIRSGYRTLGMDFTVGNYISMAQQQVTLPSALYFDNGKAKYEAEKETAFISSYKTTDSKYYISEELAGYDINGDGDTSDSFAKPETLPQAALSVSYVMVIDGQTDKDFYKVNEEGTYTAVIFNRTSDNTGAADITIDLARNTDAGSEFNMILQGPVVLHGDDIAGQQNNVLYYLPGESGEGQYLTEAQMASGGHNYEDVTQLKISCSELKTGNLNTITFDFISRNIKTGRDEIAAAYVPTTVTYQNSSSDTGTYTTTVPCQIEAARLELTGISVEESKSEKGNDVYYVGDTVKAVNPMSELSDKETDTKATFTYQWYRDDKPIEGATAQTYTLQNADYGHTVYCMITGTGDYYNSVKSGVVSKIAVDLENTEPAIDTNITITGNTVLNAQESQRTLTANLNTEKYPSNLQVTYQWYRSQEVEEGTQWVPIEGATSKTYVLTDEDWDHTLCVRAFGEQDSYAYVKTGYSTPTDTITSRNVYVYVKQDGVAADAKGTITLVNTEDDTKTYTLEKQKNTGAYGISNPEPGTYKVYADDTNSGKKVDTGLTLTTGVTTTSAIINYYSIDYETLGGNINDSPYPKYYMKNHSETLPGNVTLTSDNGTDIFLGWYLDDHYTSAVQTQVAGTEGKAMTYYAKWQYTHPVFYNLTNVTSSNTETTVWGGTAYNTTLTPPNEYYEINKDTIEIKVDGVVLSKDEYSYTEGTGLLEIGGAKTTGVIDITAQSKAKTYLISRDLEHITSNKNTVAQIEYGTNYTETLTTDAGYMTPSEITVMRGNKVLDPSLYTVTMSGRTIKVTIPGKEITDEIEIIAKAVSNEAATHTLTINYVDADGNKAADSVIQQISEGDSYSFSSPKVSGYTPDLSVVAGTMDTTDVTVNVVYRQNNVSTGLPGDTENDGQTDSSDTWVNTGAANSKGDIVYKDATSNITITVKHQDEGKTVEGITTYAYQILSITGGNKEDGYQYAVNKYYQEYFNKLLGIAEGQNATAAQVVDYLNEHLTTNDEKNKFLDDIYAYTMRNGVPDVDNETGVLNSTQFTLDCSRRYTETDGYYAGMGYYFFASEGTTGNQMTLAQVTRDMTVYIKSQQMKLEKEVAERDYHMGHQTIEYTLYAYIPNLANVGTGYKYIIHDTASKGLTLNVNSIVIIVSEDGTEDGAVELVKDGDYTVRQYTKDNENDSLEITFDFDNGTNLKENQQRGKVVKVTYTALINEDAVVGNAANPNTAYLTYSNDPYHNMSSTNNTVEDKEVVYTYGIDIFKTGGTLPDSAPLPGAEFQIQELKPEGAETLSFRPNGEGGYYKSKDAGAVSTVVTDENGKFKLYGLAAGTYMFTETKAPANYQPVETFYLKIIAEYDEEGNITSFSGDLSKAKGFVNITGTSKETGIISLKIIDPTEGSSELPATGGRGRVMIYCVGALLLIGAVVLMVIRGRKG